MTPNQAEKPENWSKVRKNQEENKYSKVKRTQPIYKIGDIVRISINKGKFGRGYHHYFKQEKFKITSIDTHLDIPTYELTSIDNKDTLIGNFYSNEITKTK